MTMHFLGILRERYFVKNYADLYVNIDGFIKIKQRCLCVTCVWILPVDEASQIHGERAALKNIFIKPLPTFQFHPVTNHTLSGVMHTKLLNYIKLLPLMLFEKCAQWEWIHYLIAMKSQHISTWDGGGGGLQERCNPSLKSCCSEIQHRFIPAVHIQHTILS